MAAADPATARGAAGRLLLAALIVAAVAGNVIWLHQDQLPMPLADSYGYLLNVLRFIDAWSSRPISEVWASLAGMSAKGRPPLYQLTSIPFILLFGRSEDAATSVNVIFIIILLTSTYRAGLLVKDWKVGLLAAFLVATYPPLIHLSHWYSPYYAVVACCALSLWLLLSLIRKRIVKSAWLFVGSLTFGLMIHPSFLWMALALGFVLGGFLLLSPTPPRYSDSLSKTPSWLGSKLCDRCLTHGILPASLIGAGLVLGWYLTRGLHLYELLQRMTAPELAEFRGYTVRMVGFPATEHAWWWPVQTAPGGISYPLAIFLVIGLIVCVFRRRAPTMVLAGTLVSCYLICINFSATIAWRYLAPLLPAAALLTAVWMVDLRRAWLSTVLPLACIAVAAFNYTVVSWGPPWGRHLATTLGASLDSAGCRSRGLAAFCSTPPRAYHQPWPVREIVERILSDPYCQRPRPCLLMFLQGKEIPQPYLYYYAVRNWPGCQLRVPTEGSHLWGDPYRFSTILNSDYLLYADNWIPKSANKYQKASLVFLQSPSRAFADAHQTIASFGGPGGRILKLIKRTRALTAGEAEIVIAAMDLPEKHKIQKYGLLARLYAVEDELEKLLALHEDAPRSILDNSTQAMMDWALADVYRLRGETKRAITLYQKALKTEPHNSNIHLRLALAYLDAGEAKKAIAGLKATISAAPDNIWARHILAKTYQNMGEIALAVAVYREILRRDPNDAVARTALAHLGK